MNTETNISLKEKMNAFEKEIRGEALQREMMRKAKRYAEDYSEYLKTAEVTDVLKVGKDTDGGYLVPDEMEEGIVEALTENNVIRKLANVFTTTERLKIPGIAQGPNGVWVEEGGEISFSDMEFFQATIDAHKNACIIRVTEELIEDAGFDIENYLIKSVGTTVGELEENAFVMGNGEHKPRGFMMDAEVGIEVPELTSDSLVDLQYSLNKNYRNKAVWIMSDSAEEELRKIKYLNGRPMWENTLTEGTPDLLLGHKVYVTKAMPDDSPIAFGDFSYYWIGERGKRSFKRMGELYSEHGLVGYRFTHRVDGKLIIPEAVKTLKIVA